MCFGDRAQRYDRPQISGGGNEGPSGRRHELDSQDKIESHYWWQGQFESSTEVLILFKTRADKLLELERCVVANHPYQTPELVALKIGSGAEKYLQWISDSVGQKG